MDSAQRHAVWLAADEGLFTSVEQTKVELSNSVEGLVESGLLTESMLDRIARSEKEILETGHVLEETSKLLVEFGRMADELTAKIASLHLQISQTRMFVAREVTAHHDKIAMGLSLEELSKMQELNAFIPEGVEVEDI